MHPSTLLASYLAQFPDEVERMRPLTEFLETNTELYDRSNMQGHITVDACVLNERNEILMIAHKSLKMNLLPGGHVDPGEDDITLSARRELLEETGLSDCTLDTSKYPNGLIDIDIHEIPARPERGEGAHLHYCFCFLFRTTSDYMLTQDDGVEDVMWRTLDETGTLPRFAMLRKKI